MATTSEIISLIQGLSEQQLEQFKEYILKKLRLGTEETEPGVKAHRCPHCRGVRVIRFWFNYRHWKWRIGLGKLHCPIRTGG